MTPGKSWKTDFSGIPWTLGPSGPSLDSRAQNSVQDSLNESSVRPNGTPVMPLLHFGHGWLFRSKTTNYLLCKFSYEGNNNYNNQRFWWQEPPGKIIFVLFCFATCRDEEKETQNINVVGKTWFFHECLGFFFREPNPICHWQICIFWPKSTRGPSDDLGRSFGIILSPKFQNPTMLVNHFHIFCKNTS